MSSTVIAKNIQIGTSGTATNNFTWYQPASPDGTVRLGLGNSGLTSADLITVNGSGTIGVASGTNLGNSATGQTYITRFSGYAVDDGGLYGSFGNIILNANGGFSGSERRWMITNALGGGSWGFSIIRSTNATTDPAIGSAGNLTSGTLDFYINWSNGQVNMPNGAVTTTQAAKTSDTTVATTAFVDRLRSLLTATTGSGGGTAVIGDRGCLLSVTAGVTIPANVFAANDTFSIYNNTAGNITITQGGSLTLRQVGTANTGNRTLAQRGLVTVVFISATEAVISGGGLT